MTESHLTANFVQELPRGRAWNLDLGIEIEERFQTGAQLLFDIFLAAFKHVHGDVCFPAIRQFHRRLPHLGHFLGRQQPHPVDQRKICHGLILRRSGWLPRTRASLPFRIPVFLI